MNAPVTLILTLPGRIMVLSISSVEVIVRGRTVGWSADAGGASDVMMVEVKVIAEDDALVAARRSE